MKKTVLAIMVMILSVSMFSATSFADATGSSFKTFYEESLYNEEFTAILIKNNINDLTSFIDTYYKKGIFTKEQRDWRVEDAKRQLEMYNRDLNDGIVIERPPIYVPSVFSTPTTPQVKEDNVPEKVNPVVSVPEKVKETNKYLSFLNASQMTAFETVVARLDTIVANKLKPSFEKMPTVKKDAQISSIEKKIAKMLQKEKSVLNQAVLEQVRIELVFLRD